MILDAIIVDIQDLLVKGRSKDEITVLLDCDGYAQLKYGYAQLKYDDFVINLEHTKIFGCKIKHTDKPLLGGYVVL